MDVTGERGWIGGNDAIRGYGELSERRIYGGGGVGGCGGHPQGRRDADVGALDGVGVGVVVWRRY